MQRQNEGIVDLDAYRQQRTPERNARKNLENDAHNVITELAYHLLKAIQAVKKLPH